MLIFDSKQWFIVHCRHRSPCLGSITYINPSRMAIACCRYTYRSVRRRREDSSGSQWNAKRLANTMLSAPYLNCSSWRHCVEHTQASSGRCMPYSDGLDHAKAFAYVYIYALFDCPPAPVQLSLLHLPCAWIKSADSTTATCVLCCAYIYDELASHHVTFVIIVCGYGQHRLMYCCSADDAPFGRACVSPVDSVAT